MELGVRMQESQYVSTAQVADALGISVSTVKRWVDSGIIPAHKTVGGHRKLLITDVLRVAEEGRFPRIELAKLQALGVLGTKKDSIPFESMALNLTDALRRGEESLARSLIHGALTSGCSLEDLGDKIVSPAMRTIGHDWETQRIGVHHEHRATQIMKGVLFELKREFAEHADVDRPAAVGGSPEFDPYTLASLLCELSLLKQGWRIVNLGALTPIRSFISAIIDYRPILIWVSINWLPSEEAFIAEYKELKAVAAEHDVRIAVGGNAVHEQLLAKLGPDLHACDLQSISEFAKKLWHLNDPPKRGRPRRQV